MTTINHTSILLANFIYSRVALYGVGDLDIGAQENNNRGLFR
jgi:hypothetical protein